MNNFTPRSANISATVVTVIQTAVTKAIVETGYKGYVAQEFIPSYDDKIAALQDGLSFLSSYIS